jgi:Spy/CpxP family protein refolding chaperone
MILAATGMAAIPASLAQGPGGRRGGGRGGMMGGERMIEMMKERLDLSEEQVGKLKKVFEDQAAKMSELRENAPEGGRPSREGMMKLREDTNTKINDVLTKEQQDEYQKMQEEMRERMRQGGRGRRGGPPQQ